MTGERAGAFPDAAIVLAGGAGRRLGGVDKASLVVTGSTLLDRVLATVAGRPVVLVGPPRDVPPGIIVVQEDPPDGGPAAGLVAGLEALTGRTGSTDTAAPIGPTAGAPAGDVSAPALVAVLAVDQPGITADTLARLAAAVPADASGGAALVQDGHRQYAAGVFPLPALTRAAALRPDWHGVALRALVDPLIAAEVPAQGAEAADVDTPQDLAAWRAQSEIPPPDSGDATRPQHRRR